MSDKIAFITTSLNAGGAESMLYHLLAAIDREQFEPFVISLTGDGPFGRKIRALGVPVRLLGMNTSLPNPFLFLRLTGWLRELRPAIVQTWMYHADLVGGLAARAIGVPVIWAIHNTSLDPSSVKRRTIWTVKVLAALSGWLPSKIISCSKAAQRVHIARGYNPGKLVLIPNGFDLGAFHPDPAARGALRQALGLSPDTFLVGLVARFDPLKDHRTFIHAVGILHSKYPDVHFLLLGDGISSENKTLGEWIDVAGIRQNCHLLGYREDVPRIMAALDVNVLSSIGEAFPIVLGEAMACELPCVTTDVGDAAEIVGDTGCIVPPQDALALAKGLERMISLSVQERQELGRRARMRIQGHYQIGEVVLRYQHLYHQLV